MFRKTAPCFFAVVIDALGFGLVYPVMTAIFTADHSPVLSTDASLAVKHFYLGLSYILYPLCMFFGTSFMGDLSDVWGRKKVLLLCMLGITISFLLMGIGVAFSYLSLLLIGRAFSGLMAGSQPIAQASIADLSTPESKALNMSLISMSFSLGSVLGPLLGGVMSDQQLLPWFTFTTPFLMAALLAFIAWFWIELGYQDTVLALSHKKISIFRPVQIFIEAFEHRSVRILALVFLLMQMGFSLYFQFIIVHMKIAYNYTNWQLGAVQGMIGLGFAIGILLGMPFCVNRYKVHHIAFATLILTGLGQLLVYVIPNPILQWPLAVAIAIFDIMAFACLLTLFSNAVDAQSQGWVMGISGAVMAFAWMVTGFGSNLLSLISSAGLIAVGGILLLVSALLLLTKRPKKAFVS
ncbi:MFS transporter [Legionella micdadei]|uniref:Major facilitator superfamily MFS_1 n=1 Tax=Legionella micdadei TaxID=451 RepID=A0A098GJI8_LEGMI|nr:MFS transporter [Legionella micdadei]ARG96942.1 MFS transporter [Legionella micdadei]KTD26652.1 transporter of the major facilitator superfamily (MFS) [Legionella micdadei]NSL19457.1 MFS transporter [Legionella micdadei]CEG61651.1 Major facilitator superfamily MFS_1 [Legionella micdadei]SCY48183.1 Predicted arabinose efflux permease, MFS family [Legionella micdadei]